MGWFGTSKDEVWRQLSQEIGAEIVEGGIWKLHFQVVGVIKDVERLKAVFDLFAAILHQLCQIGSAYTQEPGVSL